MVVGMVNSLYEFYGTVTAIDVPTIQLGTNFRDLLFNIPIVTNIPNMHLWDMSKVVHMLRICFYKARVVLIRGY